MDTSKISSSPIGPSNLPNKPSISMSAGPVKPQRADMKHRQYSLIPDAVQKAKASNPKPDALNLEASSERTAGVSSEKITHRSGVLASNTISTNGNAEERQPTRLLPKSYQLSTSPSTKDQATFPQQELLAHGTLVNSDAPIINGPSVSPNQIVPDNVVPINGNQQTAVANKLAERFQRERQGSSPHKSPDVHTHQGNRISQISPLVFASVPLQQRTMQNQHNALLPTEPKSMRQIVQRANLNHTEEYYIPMNQYVPILPQPVVSYSPIYYSNNMQQQNITPHHKAYQNHFAPGRETNIPFVPPHQTLPNPPHLPTAPATPVSHKKKQTIETMFQVPISEDGPNKPNSNRNGPKPSLERQNLTKPEASSLPSVPLVEEGLSAFTAMKVVVAPTKRKDKWQSIGSEQSASSELEAALASGTALLIKNIPSCTICVTTSE